MLIQTGHVLHIVFGFDTGWDPQRRDDGSVPFTAIVRRHRSHVAMGVLSLIAGLLISPSLVAWMSPTIAGLILSIPISYLTGQRWLGLVFRRAGVLNTPEETTTPPVAKRGRALYKGLQRSGEDEANGLQAIHDDPQLRELHERWLPARKPRQRGVISADRALAETKLAEAETIEDAVDWLNRGERLVALSDRALDRRGGAAALAQGARRQGRRRGCGMSADAGRAEVVYKIVASSLWPTGRAGLRGRGDRSRRRLHPFLDASAGRGDRRAAFRRPGRSAARRDRRGAARRSAEMGGVARRRPLPASLRTAAALRRALDEAPEARRRWPPRFLRALGRTA